MMDLPNNRYRCLKKPACKSKHALGYSFIKHIANSAAIFRRPDTSLIWFAWASDCMVLTAPMEMDYHCKRLPTLRSTIAQIRKVKAGDTVGYGRKGQVHRDSLIATVRIGYADGYGRELGNGRGHMFLHEKLAPVIGNVCMDMTMIDVTDIPGAKEGDEVEIFGKNLPVQQVAQLAGTIAYEIMTGISQRVKRVYLEE
jgi:alanine racemase